MNNIDEQFMSRSGLKPRGTKAEVHVVIAVQTGMWGPDCTVAQVVAQANDEARSQICKLINNSNNMEVLRTEVVKVVCLAEK